jgi:hypothetical protein
MESKFIFIILLVTGVGEGDSRDKMGLQLLKLEKLMDRLSIDKYNNR